MHTSNLQSIILTAYILSTLLLPNAANAERDMPSHSNGDLTQPPAMHKHFVDNFNPTNLPVIPTATSTGSHGEYKALSLLQREADAQARAMPTELYAGPTSKNPTDYVEPPEVQAKRIEARTKTEAELAATPFKDAFKASFGGYVRDIIRVSNKEEGSKEVDPSYDVGAVRQEFRSTYGEEHWAALERTRNNSQYTALVNNLKAKAKHDEILGASVLGTIGGSLFDPILIIIALPLLWLFRRKSKRKDVDIGVVQNIKDLMFLSNCAQQLQRVSPQGEAINKKFCEDNLVYFMAFRNKGYDIERAVHLGCIYMMDNSDQVMERDVNAASSLIVASNYCLNFISRWPDSECSSTFAEALAKFIEHTNNDPIAKDLAMMAARR